MQNFIKVTYTLCGSRVMIILNFHQLLTEGRTDGQVDPHIDSVIVVIASLLIMN